MPLPDFSFHGGNAEAFKDRSEEVLLSGPAGSGKSAVNLAKIYCICKKYPGARILIVRKTRESLTETVLVTWERDVLGYTHPILLDRPVMRRVRQDYVFPNGSTVVVGGIDKPHKILSSEWDIIYAAEGTELTLEDWETLAGRLRSSKVPYQQMIADCNPSTPNHWLYKRYQAGMLKLIKSKHQDNPRYWDRKAEKWTDLGVQYMARLNRMTGTRRDRFLEGKWTQAEGAVYDLRLEPEYDAEGKVIHPGHILPKGWTPPKEWPRVWAIDWGESSPTSLGVFAVDKDGRMYHYKEVYQTHLRADKLGKWMADEMSSGREPKPHTAVCDHDPDKKAEFERESGVPLMMAEKADRDKGIQDMQARFDLQEDGLPRIFFTENALCHEPDRALIEKGAPTHCVEELLAYCWSPDFLKDEPIADNDHAADRTRYCVRACDRMFPGPKLMEGSRAYLPPRPRDPSKDPLTGLPAHIFR